MLDTLSTIYQSLHIFEWGIGLLSLATLIVGYWIIMTMADPDLPLDTEPHSDRMLWTGPKGHGTQQGEVYPELTYPDMPPEFTLSPGYPGITPQYVIELVEPRIAPFPIYVSQKGGLTINPEGALTFEFKTGALSYAEFRGYPPERYRIHKLGGM